MMILMMIQEKVARRSVFGYGFDQLINDVAVDQHSRRKYKVYEKRGVKRALITE